MRFEVTRAAPIEWTDLRDVRLRSPRETPSAYGSTVAREEAFPESEWRLRANRGLTWLARSQARVVGTVTALPGVDVVHITAMYVAPEARRQGCATALLDAVVADARIGVPFTLDVLADNVAAEATYRAYGFVPTGGQQPTERDPSRVEIQFLLPARSSLG